MEFKSGEWQPVKTRSRVENHSGNFFYDLALTKGEALEHDGFGRCLGRSSLQVRFKPVCIVMARPIAERLLRLLNISMREKQGVISDLRKVVMVTRAVTERLRAARIVCLSISRAAR